MGNDYRSRNKGDTGWYYSDGKRYVPESMMKDSSRSGVRQRRRSRPYRSASYRPGGNADYYRRGQEHRYGELNRSGMVARAVFITSLSLLLLILITVGGVCIYIQTNILNKITFVDDSQYYTTDDYVTVTIEDDGDTGQGEELAEDEVAALQAMINGGLVSEENLYSEKGVTNILLLGTDNRSKSFKGSRSDTMIILSVNENTRQIVITSVMRDICVNIPGRASVDKINAAHAYGGPPLSVRTVESNFGIDIDRYICIDFFAFMDIVDALGGIELTISEQERIVMNNYISDLNIETGRAQDSGKLYKTGSNINLTGKQVLGYVRNRYTGNGDFARTERQRKALNKMIEKCKSADVGTLLKVIEAASSHMSTNYEQGELVDFGTNAFEYLDYEMVNCRLPVDDTWEYARLNGMSIIKIDITTNRKELVKNIYGK